MMKLKIYFLFILAGSSLPLAQGATRTIQFAGIASSRFSNAAINNENVKMFCTVVVVNTGGTAQKITGIKFARYDATTGGTSFSSAGTSHLIGTTLSGTDTTGTTSDRTSAVLQPGGMCIIRARFDSISFDERTGVCAGKSQSPTTPRRRRDQLSPGIDRDRPESMVMGGVLSAALPVRTADQRRQLRCLGSRCQLRLRDVWQRVQSPDESGIARRLARKNVTLMERA